MTMNLNPRDLLQLAYRTAGRIVRNPVLAEEAGERALHRLTIATLTGKEPMRPEAWLRTAAKRTACEMLRHGWSRIQRLEEHDDTPDLGCDPRVHRLREEVRAQVRPALTARQREAFDAALTCPTNKAAAAACGMAPRDFRRYLASISRRARRTLALAETDATASEHPAIEDRRSVGTASCAG